MTTEVKVPALGESISEAIVLEWLVAPGDAVALDQDLVVLETDKITVNVPSPVAGVLTEQLVAPDDEVEIGAVIAHIKEGAEAAASAPAEPTPPPAAAAPAGPALDDSQVMPAARRLIHDHGLDPEQITGTGRGGRILKEDVLGHVEAKSSSPTPPAARPRPPAPAPSSPASAGGEEIVPMSRLRQTIASRLVTAQQTAAILTTFNEVDMSAVMALRSEYRDRFVAKYGVKPGFTSFFAKAIVEALKAFPAVNAEIRGDAIVYKSYYNLGVAVGGGRGLVVPVIHDVDRLGFAEIEVALAELADKARTNKLTLADLQGGTFTISNGGVYGSMLSTPILNPPQVGILGLHKIEQRPVAIDGQVVIRPMMYLALSYDHRLIDGREAVSFLVKVKECIEDPSRILLEI